MKLQAHHLASFSLSDNVRKTRLASILPLPAFCVGSIRANVRSTMGGLQQWQYGRCSDQCRLPVWVCHV